MDSEHIPHLPHIFVQSVLLVLFVLFSSSPAQQPSVRSYESEEDLWEALNDGEITFDEFTELLDLARSGADSLLTPLSDWEALPGSEAGYLTSSDSALPFVTVPSPRASRLDLPWVSSVRLGYNTDLSGSNASDGFTVMRFQFGRWRVVGDFDHDRNDQGTWRRRSITWRPGDVTLTLGNFEPRWGRGLVVGRRTRLVTQTDESGDGPVTLGRFDGFHFATNPKRLLSTEVFFSWIASAEFREYAGGAQVVVKRRAWTLGLSTSGGSVSRPDTGLYDFDDDTLYRENNYGTHIRYINGKHEALGEFAINDDGASAKAIEVVWPLAHGRFHARAWSYGAGYLGLWGGGPGHADTRPVYIDSLYHTFSSRTSGERGFDFTTRIAVTPNVNLRWDWMSHREAPGENLQHSGIFRADIKRPAFRTTPFIRAQIDEDETESYSLGNYLWWGPEERELNLRAEFGAHYDDEVQFVRLGLGAKLQINRVVRLAPAIRWNDPDLSEPLDGYWYLYFTETVLPIQGARVEMALVWKKYENTTKDDLVELRVRGFVR
jgi:hypothetical protein